MTTRLIDEKYDRAYAAHVRTEREMVRALGLQLGFGRIMQLCEELWRERLIEEGGFPGSEFAYGPCVAFMTRCPHPIKDVNGHCDICCGTGRITKGVAKLLEESA